MTTAAQPPAPLLSFCIPTYNRCSTLLQLVRRVLSIGSDEIQVVVLDNGSTDDTLNQLAGIEDPRLVVRTNGTNRGVLFNVVNVLVQGTGDYSVLLLDKDSLEPKQIHLFLHFLRTTQPECGYCEYDMAEGTPPRLFSRGAPALQGLAYSCHHPTGYFFRTRSLREINAVERFADYGLVGHFPFEFMQAELCLRGPAAIYQAPVFRPEKLRAKQSTKSFGTNASKEDAFFSPAGRLKIAINFALHISRLNIEESAKRTLIVDRLEHGLRQSTLEYRALMANESVCEHYHIAPRRVNTWEMLRCAVLFYRCFSKQVTTPTTSLTPLNLLLHLLARLYRAFARRLSRRRR